VQEGATGRPEPPTARDSSNIDKHSNVRPIPFAVIDLWKVLYVVAFDLETSFLRYGIASGGAGGRNGSAGASNRTGLFQYRQTLQCSSNSLCRDRFMEGSVRGRIRFGYGISGKNQAKRTDRGYFDALIKSSRMEMRHGSFNYFDLKEVGCS